MTERNIAEEKLKEMLENAFFKNENIIRLKQKRQKYLENRQWQQAMEVAQEIEVLYNKAVAACIKNAQEYAEKIDIGDIHFTESEKIEFQLMVMRLFACCDIITSTIMDIESLLKRYDRYLSYENYNDIVMLNKYAKAKMVAFSKQSQYLNTEEWGDICDEMEEEMASKMKELQEKYKNL